MKAVNLYGPNDFRIDDIAEPSPGPADAVIQVAACGICGTDLNFVAAGGNGSGQPMPLGHEAAGVVAQVGSDVRGVSVGDRVAINPMGELTNVIGNGGTEGAFADRLLIRNAEIGVSLFPISDTLPLHIAAIAEPLGVARRAVNRSQIHPGETAVVFGVGPIGLGAVIWLQKKGARNIVAVDLSPERLKIAEHYGAKATVVPGRDDLAATLNELHGEANALGAPCAGTDVFIDAAGAGPVVPQVIALAKPHARLVIPAVYHEAVPVHFGQMLTKELLITTSMGYADEFADVVADLNADPGYFEAYISHRFPLEAFDEAFRTAGKRSSGKVMIDIGG